MQIRSGSIMQPEGVLLPDLTIKGVSDEVLECLRRSAEEHRRSLDSEVIHRLECSIGSVLIDPDALLARIRRLQERTSLPPLTDELLDEARGEGRP